MEAPIVIMWREKGEKGEWFVAQEPVTGVASQVRTADEAYANLLEALELYLEDYPELREKELMGRIMEFHKAYAKLELERRAERLREVLGEVNPRRRGRNLY
ncbi:hypothetical protein P8X24_08325 [Pyrococcus kukulkanii]|uniref:hypothetical protein n=1 Tax=Pyrococcus kukulkanii TaxID=1609559 RepID=UPI00356225C3